MPPTYSMQQSVPFEVTLSEPLVRAPQPYLMWAQLPTWRWQADIRVQNEQKQSEKRNHGGHANAKLPGNLSRPGRTLSDSSNELLEQDLGHSAIVTDADSRALEDEGRDKIIQLRNIFPWLSDQQLDQIWKFAAANHQGCPTI